LHRQPSHPIDYRAFLESTPLVPWEIDFRDGSVRYVGPQAADFLGYPRERWLDADFWADHVIPDDQAVFAEARAELLEFGGSHLIEYRMEHADGHVVWVSEAATAVHADGEMCGARGLLSDVTERKRLEESLARSEDRLRALLRGAPDAMVFTDDQGRILDINDQAGYLFGYTLDEIRGSSVDLLVPERLRPRLAAQREAFDRDHRQSLVDGSEFAVQRQDGQEVPVELSVSLVPVGASRQLLYALRDLTARRRVEAQLAESERRMRGMAEALPGLVSFVDASQTYRFVNETYASWVGWSREEMEGRQVRDVLGEETYERVRESIEAVLGGRPVHYRADVGRPRGDVTVDVSYVPHFDGDEVAGYFVIVVDSPPESSGGGPVRDLTRARIGASTG